MLYNFGNIVSFSLFGSCMIPVVLPDFHMKILRTKEHAMRSATSGVS